MIAERAARTQKAAGTSLGRLIERYGDALGTAPKRIAIAKSLLPEGELRGAVAAITLEEQCLNPSDGPIRRGRCLRRGRRLRQANAGLLGPQRPQTANGGPSSAAG
jgi:hypothetical protein